MKYIVIYPNGKIMAFYVKAVAEMYAIINKGTLIEEPQENVNELVA